MPTTKRSFEIQHVQIQVLTRAMLGTRQRCASISKCDDRAHMATSAASPIIVLNSAAMAILKWKNVENSLISTRRGGNTLRLIWKRSRDRERQRVAILMRNCRLEGVRGGKNLRRRLKLTKRGRKKERERECVMHDTLKINLYFMQVTNSPQMQ